VSEDCPGAIITKVFDAETKRKYAFASKKGKGNSNGG
jgi:hypothetical protein